MKKIKVNAINFLSVPQISSQQPEIKKIIGARLKRLAREMPTLKLVNEFYWPASFFGLDQCQLFIRATIQQKNSILVRCSENILLESYFIEKAGIYYCAKMAMLAENIETAQTYSLIGADEATHLQWILPFLPKFNKNEPPSKFLNFICQLIDDATPNCLRYLIQVILEGWGVEHYQLLSRDCNFAPLQQIFATIVRDEALHHHAGTVLFQPQNLSVTEWKFLRERLSYFLEMVRIGPTGVIAAVEVVLGGLTKSEKYLLVAELSKTKSTMQKLQLIKQLMSVPGCEQLIENFAENNLFTPL